METSDWIASLALVVAGGALFLEIRRWFESGPRVTLGIGNDMIVIDANGEVVEDGVVIVTANNRGDQPTTITHLVVMQRKRTWYLVKRATSRSFMIVSPQGVGMPPIIPHRLDVGTNWQGLIRPRPDLYDLRSKNLWVALYVTHSDRPILKHIIPRK